MNAKGPTKQRTAAPAARVEQTAKAGVVVVDDHPIVREGLVRVIDQTADFRVCGQAETIAQALEVIEATRPALVIADLSLGEQNGLELIKDIKLRHPQIPVLVHSMYDEAMYAERCLRAGAKGYLMKQEPPQRLLEALRLVLSGGVHLSEAMTKQVLSHMSGGEKGKGSSPAELFSDRELEIYELIGRGRSNKEIAGLLHISDKTVYTHREHIKVKLRCSDTHTLVRQAMRWVEGQK